MSIFIKVINFYIKSATVDKLPLPIEIVILNNSVVVFGAFVDIFIE